MKNVIIVGCFAAAVIGFYVYFHTGNKAPEEDVGAVNQVLEGYPLNSPDGVIDKDKVELDNQVSSDKGSSLRINTEKPIVVRLFKLPKTNVTNRILKCDAKLRSEDFEGEAYIQLFLQFSDGRKFFSKCFTPLKGSHSDWFPLRTAFMFKKGAPGFQNDMGIIDRNPNPDDIEIQLVVNGNGTVWVDDIQLKKDLIPQLNKNQ